MKIVNKEEFYKLPKGTLYSNYLPCVFSGLKIKINTLYNESEPIDFTYENMIGNIDNVSSGDYIDKLGESENNNKELKLDFDCIERDGLYEDNTLFAIYNHNDVKELITRLNLLTKL